MWPLLTGSCNSEVALSYKKNLTNLRKKFCEFGRAQLSYCGLSLGASQFLRVSVLLKNLFISKVTQSNHLVILVMDC